MSEEVTTTTRRYLVGYALAPKKVQSFIRPSLLNLAQQRGIDLIEIQLHIPLLQQGPFECIIHKLSDPQWKQQLHLYSSANPNVPIVDPLQSIERLHSRVSMLEVVNDLKISQHAQSFGIPNQIFVQNSQLLHDPTALAVQGLQFPVIAKPLVANGTVPSHHMSLVFNQQGLKGLNPPIVLQEFVNHGGVVFKVYVAGNHVKCVKRRSLPDISLENIGTSVNLLPFSQISNLVNKDQEDDPFSQLIETTEMPPLNFLTELANALRSALRLLLFNFDVIRDSRIGNRYMIIDINYFPGYAKLPSYETFMTNFFLDIVRGKQTDMETLDTEEAPKIKPNS